MPRAAAPSELGLCGFLGWLVGLLFFFYLFLFDNGFLGGFVMQSELGRALCLVTVVSVMALGCARLPGTGGLQGEQPGTVTSSFPGHLGKKAGLWGLLAPTAFKLFALAQ